ncbi:MAG TPA: hypothetical protein VGO01_20040, partial [Bradyrhizobium sp.]|nr:hypothetical protein [Bradyrhizobium sp.]
MVRSRFCDAPLKKRCIAPGTRELRYCASPSPASGLGSGMGLVGGPFPGNGIGLVTGPFPGGG